MPSAAGASLESDGSFWPFFKRGLDVRLFGPTSCFGVVSWCVLTTYLYYVYNHAYISVDRGVFKKQYMMTLCVCGSQGCNHTGPHTEKETLVLKQRLSWCTVKSLSEMSRGKNPALVISRWVWMDQTLQAFISCWRSWLLVSFLQPQQLSLSLSLSVEKLKFHHYKLSVCR